MLHFLGLLSNVSLSRPVSDGDADWCHLDNISRAWRGESCDTDTGLVSYLF